MSNSLILETQTGYFTSTLVFLSFLFVPMGVEFITITYGLLLSLSILIGVIFRYKKVEEEKIHEKVGSYIDDVESRLQKKDRGKKVSIEKFRTKELTEKLVLTVKAGILRRDQIMFTPKGLFLKKCRGFSDKKNIGLTRAMIRRADSYFVPLMTLRK